MGTALLIDQGESIKVESPEQWLKKPSARAASKAVRLGELMKTVNLHVLLENLDDVSELASWSANAPDYVEHPLNENDISASRSRLVEVKGLCEVFGFKALLREVKRNIDSVEGGCTYAELGEIAENLKTRIRDEYEAVLILWIEDKDFYQQDSLFGEQVADQFKGAGTDIKEAGTCYALGRYTACVYHSMRAVEFGLNAIAKRIEYPDDRPGWEGVIKYFDAELKREYPKMLAAFKGDVEFLAGISAHLHSFNLAWRRRVAHVERTYTEEEAKRILDATKSLMQHIATKLSEN